LVRRWRRARTSLQGPCQAALTAVLTRLALAVEEIVLSKVGLGLAN
jgi:hypothetical protein